MRTAKIAKIAALLVLMISMNGCVEEEPIIVPYVHVDFSIDLRLPQYSPLNAFNNAIIVGGYGYNNNGVIIYRLNLEEFYAFDATCPQHIEKSTAVTLDDNDPGYAICPHCQVTYELMNYGQASKGYPLKRYRTYLNGNILRVYN